jgi:hypothetical protein
MRVAEEYLRKAEGCDRLASQVSDLTIKPIWRANGVILPSKPAAFDTGQANALKTGYRCSTSQGRRSLRQSPHHQSSSAFAAMLERQGISAGLKPLRADIVDPSDH